MFKLLKYLVILVVVLVVGAIIAAYFGVEYAVKRVVQAEGTAQLNVPVTIGSAGLNPFSGSVSVSGLTIGSPTGFTAPQMLSVGSSKVATTGLTHLLDKPLHVTLIEVDSTKLVIEQHGLKLNFKELLDGLPQKSATGETKPSPSTAGSNPMRFVIDTLSINGSTVDFIPDAAGAAGGVLGKFGAAGAFAAHEADKKLDNSVKPTTITLPSLEVKNIGNADGKMQGAEVKDVVTAIVTAMAQSAIKTANLPIDPSLLSGNLDSVKGKASDAVQKQLDKLPGGTGNMLNGLMGGKK